MKRSRKTTKIHKKLGLHPHKHTGKLLPHKHTSYGILFLLMLVPIALMALVGQLAAASNIVVSATVPAPVPPGAPDITSPSSGTTVNASTVTLYGTCPVATPSIIVTIYDNSSFIGSVSCASDGTFSIPITLAYGTNSLVATTETITGGIGGSSSPVSIIRPQPVPPPSPSPPPQPSPSPSPPPQDQPMPPIEVGGGIAPLVSPSTTDKFIVMGPDRRAVWRGKFTGGVTPYTVVVDWGDGTKEILRIASTVEQVFSHIYKDNKPHNVVISVTDARGVTTVISSAVATYSKPPLIVFDTKQPASNPILAFVQKYMTQIYIGAFFALIFLWYLEHGRHIVSGHLRKLGKKRLQGHH